MNAADLLVLPSVAEAFGLVLVEAMASGLAVIAVDTHGPAEIVKPDTGWLIPPDDQTALTDALVLSANDRAERQRRSTHASPHARRHYSWQRISQPVAQVYAQTITDNAHARNPSQQRRRGKTSRIDP